MSTKQPDPTDFDFELIAPISRFLTNLNRLQTKPNGTAPVQTTQEPDIAEVLSSVMSSASKISETISTELLNIMDATDSSIKEPNFNTLIKNITDIMSAPSFVNTSNASVNTGHQNIVIGSSAVPSSIPAEMHGTTVCDSPVSPNNPFSKIDLMPNIDPPNYVDNKTTTKTIKLNKEFARDIPAMFSSKYYEFRNLNLPAEEHKELRIKVNNDLYNAIEQAYNISIGTLTKYAVQPYPSINELIQEHNPNIRLPTSGMNELVKYLSNYSGTYNPDKKMEITSHRAKHVKFLMIDWLKTHPEMYIIL